MERIKESVQVEISLHQVINALESFAKTYPIERLAPNQIERIIDAARLMDERITQFRQAQKDAEAVRKASRHLYLFSSAFPILCGAEGIRYPVGYKTTGEQLL